MNFLLSVSRIQETFKSIIGARPKKFGAREITKFQEYFERKDRLESFINTMKN